MTPSDHTSMASLYAPPVSISGAMYATVPVLPRSSGSPSPKNCASPKSHSFTSESAARGREVSSSRRGRRPWVRRRKRRRRK